MTAPVDPDGAAAPTPLGLRSIAVEVATAGAAMVAGSARRDAVATKATATDIVTETDLATEALVRDLLASRTPGARVLGEEGGHADAGAGPCAAVEWVVDPLDGTVNFAYGLPVSAVSVAAVVAGRPVAGAVVDVHRGEIFAAHLGGGATCDGVDIAAGDRTDPGMALVATGFSYRPELRRSHGDTVARLLGVVRDVRAFGSAALHLCWVGAGRLDAYVERDIKPWDYAAGSLIATEAGASVELPCTENGTLVLAANPTLASALRPLVA